MDQTFKIKKSKMLMLNFKWIMIISTNRIKSIFSKVKILKTRIKTLSKTIKTVKILSLLINSKIILTQTKVFNFLKYLKIKNK